MEPTLFEQIQAPQHSNMMGFEAEAFQSSMMLENSGMFINAENKALIQEIRKKKANAVELENKMESHKGSKQLMDELIKNSEKKQEDTEELRKANEIKVQCVKHLKAVTERKAGGQSQQMTKIENKLPSFAETGKVLENRKNLIKLKLEDCRKLMYRAQEKMDDFLEESTRKNEDSMAIIKYSEQDEQRIKSLTRAKEKKTLEANEKRKTNDKERTETISAQLASDKATDNLQQTHLKIQGILHLWEKNVKHIAQYDPEMNKCAMQLVETQKNFSERNATIKERKHLLDTQSTNNKETDRKMSVAQRQAVKLRRDLKERENNFRRLQDELESCKGARDKATSTVMSVMSNISRMKKDVQHNDKKLEEARACNTALEVKLKEVTQTALTEEERAAQMDQFLRDKDEANKRMDVKLRDHKQEIFLHKDHLKALKTKEMDAVAHVSRSKSTNCLKMQLREQENVLSKQNVIFSELDSKAINLDRKMAHLQGAAELDKTQDYKVKIAELTKVLEEKTTTTLAKALKESEEDIRTLKKEMEKSEAQKKIVMEKIADLNICCATSEKELKTLQLRKQDDMVEHNILKVEVTRIRDLLFDKTDTVMSLEKRKLGLQKALKEREAEIKVYREMLVQKRKFSEQERQKLSTELKEKLFKAERLKDRFEVKSSSMAPPENDVDKWVVRRIIMATTEKEELKRKGDALHAEILKIQQENCALDNTNCLFFQNSSALDQSLKKQSESSPEYQEKVKLQEELRQAEETLVSKMRQAQELDQNFEDMNTTLMSLLQEEQVVEDKMKDKRSLTNKLKRETTSQQEKIDRANKQCSKLIKQIRSAKSTTSETLEELDIKLWEFKDFNKSFDQMLREVVKDNPDLKAVLETNFLQANLSFPAPSVAPTSRYHSKSSSSRSSVRCPASSVSSSQMGEGHHSYTLKTVELVLT